MHKQSTGLTITLRHRTISGQTAHASGYVSEKREVGEKRGERERERRKEGERERAVSTPAFDAAHVDKLVCS